MKYEVIKKRALIFKHNQHGLFAVAKIPQKSIFEGNPTKVKVRRGVFLHAIDVIQITGDNKFAGKYVKPSDVQEIGFGGRKKYRHLNPDGSITAYYLSEGIAPSGAEGSASKIFNEEVFVVGIGGGLIGTGIGVILGVNTKTVTVLAAAGVVLGGVIAMGGGSEQKMGMAGRVPFKPTQPLYPSSGGATSKPRKECAHYNTENVCDRWRDV